MTLGSRAVLATSFLGAPLLAWIVTVERMRGMDAGPGTDLGALGWFIGIWVTMMAAMMLPSAAPTGLVVARLRGYTGAWVFALGYLLAWTVFGVAAYAAYRGIRSAAPSFVAWDEHGPLLAGTALAAAGLYQLTPLKDACLRHCRSPLHFLMGGRPSRVGDLRMGAAHGAYCIGCCAGLMLVLFALGVMSLFWMAVVAAVILAEKTLPRGDSFARVVAVALVVLGVWVAVSPGSVPGLTEPMQMDTQMQ